nr:probable enoyl-CoA hydratase 2, mitochondrial [Ipomoea batatas]
MTRGGALLKLGPRLTISNSQPAMPCHCQFIGYSTLPSLRLRHSFSPHFRRIPPSSLGSHSHTAFSLVSTHSATQRRRYGTQRSQPAFFVQSSSRNQEFKMVVVLRSIAKSFEQQLLKQSKHYSSSQLITHLSSFNSNSQVQQWQFQNRRTLILEPVASQSIKLEQLSDSDSGILELKLDRPDRKNAIGKAMLRELRHVFDRINNERLANVLMISSSLPTAFCAGADLKERKTMTPLEVQEFVNTLRSTFSMLEELCIPTIAAIDGTALGGGLEMALCCDLRVCWEAAVLGLPETGLAIIPGAGGSQRLPRLVGKSVAKDLIFTARKIDGKEALLMGLVNYCVPAGEARLKALEIAQEINQKGPLAIKMAKRAIDKGFEVDLESGLALEEDCYDQLLNTKDRLEGLAAFAERRKPKYTGE